MVMFRSYTLYSCSDTLQICVQRSKNVCCCVRYEYLPRGCRTELEVHRQAIIDSAVKNSIPLETVP
jgi:hypothetical protein